MNETIVEQTGGKNSNNVQNNDMSQNVLVVQNGMSYSEVKEVALDVYRNEEAKNFSKESALITQQRVEELVDSYLTVIFGEIPHLVERLKKPSMQYSLFNAEKGYALDETQTTKDYYIEMLKSRLKAKDRSVLQIGLDEAIKSVEKITKDQMDCLTFMFLIYKFPYNLNNIDNLTRYCKFLCDFYHESFENQFNVISLRSVNACTSLDGAKSYIPIQEWLNKAAPGMFYKGQNNDEIIADLQIESLDIIKPLLIKSVWDNDKLQINALNFDTLNKMIGKYSLEEMRDKIVNMFNKRIMTQDEIKEKLINLDSRMDKVLYFWENNDLKYSRLTPSGLIIAISNYNNKKDGKIEFEKYLN